MLFFDAQVSSYPGRILSSHVKIPVLINPGAMVIMALLHLNRTLPDPHRCPLVRCNPLL